MSAACKAIVKELEALGSESYRRVLRKHGVRDPLFGVKIGELKKIQKRIKRDRQLALDLYATGIYDAMYLAGLIADDKKMTKRDLQRWVDEAYCPAIAESTVAWVTSEGDHGLAMALKWMDSKKPVVAAAGWATLSCVLALTTDDQLDAKQLKKLLEHVEKTIADQPSEVRSTMNRFVIALGSYFKPLTAQAIAAAKRIGKVSVDVGDTACKVPSAAEYINKAKSRGAIGAKRKTVKC
jgi:3-methyladenine DNA glycosylase AlkD